MNTHAAPTPLLSVGAPTSAVLPLAETATLVPNSPVPISPLPMSFSPCWVHFSLARANTHTAPAPPLSVGPPITAVLPVAESATASPNSASAFSPLPMSFSPCWVQVEPERVNAHAAPIAALSVGPPISAVFPSEESATLEPNSPGPASPLPVSSLCWVHFSAERVNTHAAPVAALSR